MADFLLELLSEEIPARMQGKARADLEKLFTAELDAAGLKAESLETWSTPRRLALIARGLPEETQAVREERKGPKADAPDQAVDGFLRSTGLTRDDLEVRDVKGKPTYFAVIDKPGRATADVLGEAIPAIIRAFPWPKSMRWGAASASTESQRWVRPLQGIVAILGDRLVECKIDGIVSGYETVGHRFHHDGPITIGGADDYAEKLRVCHVIVDHKEREGIIRTRANELAEAAGLTRKQDPGLVEENAGLTEWPVPLLGSFDESFLEVAPEAITLAMRSHQKYFACLKSSPSFDGEGNQPQAGGGAPPSSDAEASAATSPSKLGEDQLDLSPHFICVANLDAADGGAHVVAGNEKVLAARLSDAKFFWEQDQKVSLAEHAKKLDQIVFHEKLGTVADKVDRVAKLARWLAEEGIVPNADPDKAEQAARLAKADLVTGMVGEFADLQGIMGGYYAANEGLDAEVSAAIRDHYKPVGQGDDVPTAPVTVAVSLADKLDTLSTFFFEGLHPTGSKDPFALRRQALGILRLIFENGLRVRLGEPLGENMAYFAGYNDGQRHREYVEEFRRTARKLGVKSSLENMSALTSKSLEEAFHKTNETLLDLRDFFADRLKVQQREAGVRHDLIDAVFALGGEDDLVRLLARVEALQEFLKTVDGANLLAGYKRAANILKKEGWGEVPSPLVGEGQGEGRDAGTASPTKISSDADASGPSPLSSPTRGEEAVLPYNPEPEEALLRQALDSAEPKAAAAIEAEDFEGAMAALATLRKPIDAFFEKVTVNDEDEVKRASRLDMLARFRDAVHSVANFSKIEG